MSRTPTELHAAAFHEAGHAVASWRLGDGILRVTIRPGRNHRTGVEDGGHFQAPAGHEGLKSGRGFRRLVMIFAGASAQRRHNPLSNVADCAIYDLMDADDLAFVMCRSKESVKPLCTWAQSEADALINANWHLVEAVAAELIEKIDIDGELAVRCLISAEQKHRLHLNYI